MAQCVLPIFGLEGVNMDGSIGRLGSNVFVERIPRHTLDVMAVLSNLPNKRSCWFVSVFSGEATWR